MEQDSDRSGAEPAAVLRRVHESAWALEGRHQLDAYLEELRGALVALGLEFQTSFLYLVERRGQRQGVRCRELAADGLWLDVGDEVERDGLLALWEEQGGAQPVVAADGYTPPDGRQELQRRCAHLVEGGLEVPFTHGVLGLYSSRLGALGPLVHELLDHVAIALSSAFRRLDDLDALAAKERQLRQVQRLQLIGQLTAELAHEINNPLTVVLGECDLILDGGVDEAVEEGVRAIAQAGQQAKEVGARLLEFVRGQKAEKEWLSLNRLVLEALEPVRRALVTDGIELEPELGRNLPWVHAHAGQLQQVVLNLLQNSRDALSAYRLQGRIRVRTGVAGKQVFLEVEDNGPGIPADIQEHVFEPFFTTKEHGRGTGLGLSVCAGIATEHGGELRLEPRVMGTCMVLSLPIRQPTPVSAN